MCKYCNNQIVLIKINILTASGLETVTVRKLCPYCRADQYDNEEADAIKELMKEQGKPL